MPSQGGAMGHVESTLPALGQAGACGRNNYGISHFEFLFLIGFWSGR
jgi:hypothetical protein